MAIACAGAATTDAALAQSQGSARAYLMRGLFDVSTGLDDLAAKLRSRGVRAIVDSYTASDQLAAAAIRAYAEQTACPIVVIGHSMGAEAAVAMAEKLAQAKVPVAVLVTFSPAYPRAVPANVGRIVNYYQSNSALWPNRLSGPAKSRVRNVDLANDAAVNHLNIEKLPRLHEETLRLVAAAKVSCGVQHRSAPKTATQAAKP
ncbi:MAG: alpha/beta fold hydrolase [Hyphomicrobiaceae bacterium]|nr:alpha/beta fold hydrolase [Hyphomicrobiaceae bacterium]